MMFNKKIKIGPPEYSLILHPPTTNSNSFLPYPLYLPLKVEVICLSPLTLITTIIGKLIFI